MLVKVDNLRKDISNEELLRLFNDYAHCVLLFRRGRKAFVEFDEEEIAKYAVSQLNGIEFKGRLLRVAPTFIPSWVLKSSEHGVLSSWNRALYSSLN